MDKQTSYLDWLNRVIRVLLRFGQRAAKGVEQIGQRSQSYLLIGLPLVSSKSPNLERIGRGLLHFVVNSRPASE
jgi:hypothetical protein